MISQLPVEAWHPALAAGDPTLADAILDRLVRDAHAPRPAEKGWKDVVWLGPNQTIRVQHEFANFTGRFVFHCHNGSHEDHDMMGQFEVEPGGNQ